MTRPIRSHRRWRPALVATTGLVLTAAGVAVANAATAPTPPTLAFLVATTTPTLTRYVYSDGNSYVDGDLGANVVAGRDPFEIRVTRKSYADPIVASQVVVTNGKKKSVPLPAGMVTDFTGFKAFSTITMKNAAGATVLTDTGDFCPNTWGSSRTRPDAPDSSPYPQECSFGNPFLLGNVWGIQAGWNSPIGVSSELNLPDGVYPTTIEINKKYRDYFKIPAEQAKATLNVKVETVIVDENGRSAAALRSKLAKRQPAAVRAAAAGHVHAAEGDPAGQVSAYDPAFRPPTRRPAAVAAAAVPKGPRPDLRTLPAWGISLNKGGEDGSVNGEVDGRQYIEFGATVWNAGTSTLVVDGFRRTGTDLMDAYQYFFDAAGKQVGSTTAGTMQWDPREGHKHWHFTDFAQYRLLGADKKLVVKSGKEAFCLANTDHVDDTIPNAKWRPGNTDLSTSCGANTAVAVREVLDIGGGDTYTQARPGQSFDVTDLPNGTYYIEVLANPAKVLSELSTTNNSSLRQVILSGTGADRKLTVPPVNGIEG